MRKRKKYRFYKTGGYTAGFYCHKLLEEALLKYIASLNEPSVSKSLVITQALSDFLGVENKHSLNLKSPVAMNKHNNEAIN